MTPPRVVLAFDGAGASTRPMPVTTPISTAVAAVTEPMKAPRVIFSAVDASGAVDGAPRASSQVSRAGAPPAPARASGVQAKRKTMSEPV